MVIARDNDRNARIDSRRGTSIFAHSQQRQLRVVSRFSYFLVTLDHFGPRQVQYSIFGHRPKREHLESTQSHNPNTVDGVPAGPFAAATSRWIDSMDSGANCKDVSTGLLSSFGQAMQGGYCRGRSRTASVKHTTPPAGDWPAPRDQNYRTA